ncbi:glycosyltransferase family 39 protein [Singulisphaera rosea]
MTSRQALWLLIVISALFRMAWSSGLGLGNDEAYHYLFSVHPDWSYFDHPPMLALVERLGIALCGGVVSAFSLRLGFILLFAGSTWLMASLASRIYGPRAGFLAALALNVTAYLSVAAGSFALPDGPLLFFWLLTLDSLVRAFENPTKNSPWVAVGLAWGGAMLSKYHAVFLPLGTVVYLVVEPQARRILRTPGPYVAMVLGLLAFAPVLFWNAIHGWASFAFQGGRALGGLAFRPDTLLAAILGPVVYLLPWIWASLVLILFRKGKSFREPVGESRPTAERLLYCQAVVPLVVFLAVACTRPLLPHWTLVAFLSLFPMLGQVWSLRSPRLSTRWILIATLPPVIATLVLAQARLGIFQVGGHGTLGLLRVSRDPTLDLYGWDQIGRELERRGLLDRPGTFLFTSAWYYSGHLGFETRQSKTPVLCYNSWDARSFSYWSRPRDWIGQDGILVSFNDRLAEPGCYERFFSKIEPLGTFDVERAGAPVRRVRFFRCVRQIEPFPFDGFQKPVEERRVARRVLD